MNDFVYPEDVGREVKEWAKELPSDGARGGRWKEEETEEGGPPGPAWDSGKLFRPVSLRNREDETEPVIPHSRSPSSPLFVPHRVLSGVFVHRQKKT